LIWLPDPRDQVRIVSRIAPSVASEGSPAVRSADENETHRKTWHSGVNF